MILIIAVVSTITTLQKYFYILSTAVTVNVFATIRTATDLGTIAAEHRGDAPKQPCTARPESSPPIDRR